MGDGGAVARTARDVREIRLISAEGRTDLAGVRVGLWVCGYPNGLEFTAFCGGSQCAVPSFSSAAGELLSGRRTFANTIGSGIDHGRDPHRGRRGAVFEASATNLL